MAFTLEAPIRVGDLSNGFTIDELEIEAISINLQKAHTDQGNAVLSVVLGHPASGWQTTITYRDASVLAFWASLQQDALAGLIRAIWDKLVADGKLPAGTVVSDIPAAAIAQQALRNANSAPASTGLAKG